MLRLCRLAVAVVLVLLPGMLAAQAGGGAWRVADLAAADGEVVAVGDRKGRVIARLSTAQMRMLYAVERAIARAAETEALFVIVPGEVPNAFAGTGTRRDGSEQDFLAINFAMLDLIGSDMHAAAALLGHELAHLKLRHGERAADRAASTGVLGALGSAILGQMGVPAGGLLTDLTVSAVQSGYSRDNEREADYLGAIWAVEAGFEVDGAVRLHEALAALGATTSTSFFSSHPSGPERIATLRALAARLGRAPPRN